MSTNLTISGICDMLIDPRMICAGNPVIPYSNFTKLATMIEENVVVGLSAASIEEVLRDVAKNYTACGANFGEKQGVLGKSALSGWKRVEAAIKKAQS